MGRLSLGEPSSIPAGIGRAFASALDGREEATESRLLKPYPPRVLFPDERKELDVFIERVRNGQVGTGNEDVRVVRGALNWVNNIVQQKKRILETKRKEVEMDLAMEVELNEALQEEQNEQREKLQAELREVEEKLEHAKQGAPPKTLPDDEKKRIAKLAEDQARAQLANVAKSTAAETYELRKQIERAQTEAEKEQLKSQAKKLDQVYKNSVQILKRQLMEPMLHQAALLQIQKHKEFYNKKVLLQSQKRALTQKRNALRQQLGNLEPIPKKQFDLESILLGDKNYVKLQKLIQKREEDAEMLEEWLSTNVKPSATASSLFDDALAEQTAGGAEGRRLRSETKRLREIDPGNSTPSNIMEMIQQRSMREFPELHINFTIQIGNEVGDAYGAMERELEASCASLTVGISRKNIRGGTNVKMSNEAFEKQSRVVRQALGIDDIPLRIKKSSAQKAKNDYYREDVKGARLETTDPTVFRVDTSPSRNGYPSFAGSEPGPWMGPAKTWTVSAIYSRINPAEIVEFEFSTFFTYPEGQDVDDVKTARDLTCFALQNSENGTKVKYNSACEFVEKALDVNSEDNMPKRLVTRLTNKLEAIGYDKTVFSPLPKDQAEEEEDEEEEDEEPRPPMRPHKAYNSAYGTLTSPFPDVSPHRYVGKSYFFFVSFARSERNRMIVVNKETQMLKNSAPGPDPV